MRTKLILIALLISIGCIAQNSINYKALIKDANGNVLSSTPVMIQLVIYEGAALTNNVYQENHTINSDENGFVVLNIGEGTTTDVFSAISWNNDEHFLNVQVDIGSGLVDLGTTQFMAVPYALSSGDHPWDKDENGVHTINTDVGIGVNNPEAQLDIKGGDWNLDAGNPGDLRIGNATNNFRIGIATGGGGAGITRMYTNTNNLILGTNNSPVLTLDHNGSITAPNLTNNLIDNAGNKSLITKEYANEMYGNNQPVTKEIIISPLSFSVAINTAYFSYSGGTASSENGSIIPIFAPVELPIGATITEVSLYFRHDTSESDRYFFSLNSKDIETLSESSIFSLITSSTQAFQTLTSTIPVQIMSDKTYFLKIRLATGSTWSSYSGVTGVKITYTN